MEEIDVLIAKIETKVEELLLNKRDLEMRIVSLEAENERLNSENAVLKKEKNELESKDITVKLTKAVEQNEDIDELRARINELLQKVNKSLALLVTIQNKDVDDGRENNLCECGVGSKDV